MVLVNEHMRRIIERENLTYLVHEEVKPWQPPWSRDMTIRRAFHGHLGQVTRARPEDNGKTPAPEGGAGVEVRPPA